MSIIRKGTVSEVAGSKCRVVPSDESGGTSPLLTIPAELQETIEVGLEVVYVQFDDFAGLVINRMDGE